MPGMTLLVPLPLFRPTGKFQGNTEVFAETEHGEAHVSARLAEEEERFCPFLSPVSQMTFINECTSLSQT